ncbi:MULTISPECIES: T9SS type A sorting domain-containing protein [Chryseobacterium]|uniref:Secretion system C-terminal sorting domain-containing protein n=1 Tax=Chryseobacterium geocarposphaerae TaxID=1416776 RepID=A0ABU1LB45_9FLAO|nr:MULTISPECIES: T9SS type A sorting domain-containing protein [Chryseobacterium]MDR6403939.1 hypothetical protein [Chryseobacterium geocarposphaerae]MDR6698542.1 hypothetical protein [Chryseobacterium ginsenosidimutans]
MKTNNCEIIIKHFVLLDSAATDETFRLSMGGKQRCLKKITRSFLVTAITLFYSHAKAQVKTVEPSHETPSNVITSLYSKERSDISNFTKNQSSSSVMIDLHANEVKAVMANQDYFSADLFLNDNLTRKAPTGHNTQVTRYDNKKILLDGLTRDNLTVYEILDRYTLRDKNIDSDYLYDNTYYLFRDEQGNNVATVYYIDRTIGFLKSEYKIVTVEKQSAAFPLVVAPNPARHMISITYQVEKNGEASLQIMDMNGRIADTVFRNKQVGSGKHTVQHNINLPAGNYLLQFNVKGQSPVTQKLIVQ